MMFVQVLLGVASSNFIDSDLFQNPQYELLIDTEFSWNKLQVDTDSLIIGDKFHW
jgi:hypothetical protein